ncbi:MAG TPA: hypothetical protein VN626_10975 [Clostridia bacterium]|nr:hypothetical protein [Clostridia bacterium]
MSKYADDFLLDFKINVNDLADGHSQALFLRCTDLATHPDGTFTEADISILSRLAQEAYYQALDTMVEALRVTILGDDDQ